MDEVLAAIIQLYIEEPERLQCMQNTRHGSNDGFRKKKPSQPNCLPQLLFCVRNGRLRNINYIHNECFSLSTILYTYKSNKLKWFLTF